MHLPMSVVMHIGGVQYELDRNRLLVYDRSRRTGVILYKHFLNVAKYMLR